MTAMSSRIVLAYTGGLDTTAVIPWLAGRHGAEVVTVTLDVGQGRELDAIRERALAAGAARAHVMDAREAFARDYVLPALGASALYEGRYPLATALSRPLIAQKLVEVASLEGAAAIAHGCTEPNDRVRIEAVAGVLSPGLPVLAPTCDWGLSRAQVLAYARARRLPLPPLADTPYRVDQNLWGRSIECGVIDDPWQEPPDDVYALTRPAHETPATAAYVEVTFHTGVPVAVNGVSMGLVELIDSLNTIAGQHGVGRIDMVENSVAGTKTREIYEAPAAVVLHQAHKELEIFVSPRELDRMSRELSITYADLVYNGQWFTPAREALDRFFAAIQARVTGAIRAKLYKGSCTIVGRRAAAAA